MGYLPGTARAGFWYTQGLGVFANLRPLYCFPVEIRFRPEGGVLGDGLDIMVVRELTGGIYFGQQGRWTGSFGQEAWDTEAYSASEVERWPGGL